MGRLEEIGRGGHWARRVTNPTNPMPAESGATVVCGRTRAEVMSECVYRVADLLDNRRKRKGASWGKEAGKMSRG